MNHIVYKIIFPNNKVYIGITARGLKQRMYEHSSRSKNGYKNKLYCAMRKYENFKIEILEKLNTYDEAKIKEIKYISEYKSNGLGGYNLTNGGDGHLGYRVSSDTRKKQSAAHTGVPLSKLHREALSKAKKGKKRSQEFCRMMSKIQKGKKRDLKTIQKIKNTLSKPFNVYCKYTGNFVGYWKNISECADVLNIHRNSISNVFAGRSKSAGGYTFERTIN